jgi:ATP-dependent RNA helicase RhlE
MKLPVHVEVAPSGTTAERIVQELFIVKKEAKRQLLGKILKQYHGSVLLFSRTKRGAANITRTLRGMGHNAAEIHSDRSLGQRKEALAVRARVRDALGDVGADRVATVLAAPGEARAG